MNELRDEQQFGRRGEAWFLAQAGLLLLVLFPPMSLKGLVAFAGILSLSGGLGVIGYALFSLGRNLSPLPQPRTKHELVTSGMYSKWEYGTNGSVRVGG